VTEAGRAREGAWAAAVTVDLVARAGVAAVAAAEGASFPEEMAVEARATAARAKVVVEMAVEGKVAAVMAKVAKGRAGVVKAVVRGPAGGTGTAAVTEEAGRCTS
jgi:hypothetical protein